MKLVEENATLSDFQAWCGAVKTKNKIIEAGLEIEFLTLIDEEYPEGITPTQLNDYLWFDSEYIYSMLGLDEDGNVID